MTNAILAFLTGSLCVQLTFINWTLERIADALEKLGESEG